VTANFAKLVSLAAAIAFSVSCGDFVRQGRSPVQLIVKSLQAASGADPSSLSGVLHSDVITNIKTPAPCSDTNPCPTVFSDPGSAVIGLQLKDQGSLGVLATPSLQNQVTITRYRVEYRRTDGRNQQGVDVPFAFDSAATFSILADTDGSVSFQIVRHAAKEEAPLRALVQSGSIISTIATVTFYGHDMAGNDVSVSGNIGIDFGDFGDPN